MAAKKTAAKKTAAKKAAKKAANANKAVRKASGSQVSQSEIDRLFKNLDLRELNRQAAGPTVTKSGKSKGRNPHVGLNIPDLTTAERKRREAARKARKAKKARPGTVRSVNRRK